MKYLLCAVNTKYIHSNPAVYILQEYVRRHVPVHTGPDEPGGPELDVAEFTINQRVEDVNGEIYERQPDVLFFSCYIWNYEFVLKAAEDLHKVLPQTDIWLGGPEVSFGAEDVVQKHDFLKGVMIGEGERCFLELIRFYQDAGPSSHQNGRDRFDEDERLRQIPGICYRSLCGRTSDGPSDRREGGVGRIITTEPAALISMDDVPFIYNHENLPQFDHKILYYESSRGCPFSCSYCLSSIGKTVRFRSLGLVFQELQFFLDHQVPQVKFIDRTFNIDSHRSEEILRYLLEHDNGTTNFHFEVAGELLSDGELRIMEQMRPGLIQLEIGVQSTNPDTLRQIRRKADMSRLRQVVSRLVRARNIHLHLDLIAGLPGESYEIFRRSFDEVYAMSPTQLQLGFLKVLKGTEMQQRTEEYGVRHTGGTPYEVLETRWITYAQIRKLKRIEEMVELYYNSRQFTKTLTVLETEFSSPFVMYEQLAEFYKNRGYFTNSPARIHRYQVLLEFVQVTCKAREELYRELLTFDLYYRENLKSRPGFAPDQTKYKELLREQKQPGLHMEILRYPVYKERAEEITDPEQNRPRILVFDYGRRDPLDNNVSVEVRELSSVK